MLITNVYNTVDKTTTVVSSTDYTNAFNAYKEFYYPTNTNNIKTPILNDYFFAVDYRPNSSFKWENVINDNIAGNSSINGNKIYDSSNGIYIRKVDPANYNYSKTQDDYKTYYDGTIANPQFTPINAKIIQTINGTAPLNEYGTYYYLPYSLSNGNSLSLSSLIDVNGNGILELNSYYEVIESDEAGNYRVYGIYIPEFTTNKVNYTYKTNADSFDTPGTINYNDNSIITVNGIEFALKHYQTKDRFIRASIEVDGNKEYIAYDPNNHRIHITNSKNEETKQ